jgi:Mrp family chromosome partitioning ATPase
MSAIDQAFIRAYESDESAAGPGRPVDAQWAVEPARVHAPHFQTPAASSHVSDQRAPSGSERRPLSAFAMKGPAVEARFKPALEVDALRWSGICDALISTHRDRLRSALHSLLAADDAGRSLIGIASPAPGAGCTTVLACLARLLADAGKTVAIVDGNFAAPLLARQLGLAVEMGWEEVLSGRLPLAEGVIYSLADRIAVLPLAAGGAAAAGMLNSIHASVTAGVLRYHYDMVLFDLGAIGDRSQGETARRIVQQCRLDGAVLATGDSRASAVNPQWLMHSAPELASICMGIIETQRRAG